MELYLYVIFGSQREIFSTTTFTRIKVGLQQYFIYWQVASRAVFIAAGVTLMICGVIGKVGAALALIPQPIIGGTLLLGLGMVASIGISGG
jgi:xanthine/uracil permease